MERNADVVIEMLPLPMYGENVVELTAPDFPEGCGVVTDLLSLAQTFVDFITGKIDGPAMIEAVGAINPAYMESAAALVKTCLGLAL